MELSFGEGGDDVKKPDEMRASLKQGVLWKSRVLLQIRREEMSK